MPKIIDSFSGYYRFLSNFYPSPIELDRGGSYEPITFPTAEHAFQAFKCLYTVKFSEDDAMYWAAYLATIETPAEVKRLGRGLVIDIDRWNAASEMHMCQVVTQKFVQNPDLHKLLLETEDAVLVEGNTWGDRLWGQVNGQGENRLGKILMEVRERLTPYTPLW